MRVLPPALIATDLDGTIVRADKTVSARTVTALTRVEKAGTHVVFVTGRPPRLMADITAAFGSQGIAICSNGALLFDMHSRTVGAERAIEPAALAEAARRLRAAAPGIGLAIEYADTLAGDELYEPGAWDVDVTVQRLPEDRLWSRPAPKLIGRHPRLSADELVRLAAPAMDGLVTVYHSNGERLVEAIASGVSKASALADLAARLDVRQSDVAAFGDMPNDLPMLAWAGTSYGVANAHPAVLDAVDHIVPANDEDGVAQTVERLFPEIFPEIFPDILPESLSEEAADHD
ncbi:HAD-IIB family hydrolase [Streptomyces sp. MST-110588]|uniref:HAD family hydrolase n=1 Tax=Streptomyces sp. MST-110588 TaxID=2833628 RepID=UPI001F5E0119|nr:HAD-IIB family hydrolase [Streptomyces sp. MST-110588]UNO39178.1 HAD-IIB family hydrolase [Streptomyces sp. MST-110588]